jgi:hypothetical protein
MGENLDRVAREDMAGKWVREWIRERKQRRLQIGRRWFGCSQGWCLICLIPVPQAPLASPLALKWL